MNAKTAESRLATIAITILPDTAPSELRTVVATADYCGLVLYFSKPMEKTAAEQAANYKLDAGASVEQAVLSVDGKQVTLTTSQLKANEGYTLQLLNLRDQSSKGNTLAQPAFKFQAIALVPGLLAEIFESTNFTGKAETRIDSQVNYPVTGRGGRIRRRELLRPLDRQGAAA